MLIANTTRDINQAARAAAKFLMEQGVTLSHAQALTLVARTMGKAQHMANQADLPSAALLAPQQVRTYRELRTALDTLSSKQLDMSLTFTAGCDVNGNAEFFPGATFLPAGDLSMLAATDGVLEASQPVLLFEETVEDDSSTPDVDPAIAGEVLEKLTASYTDRIAAQFELASGQSGDIARAAVAERGLGRGMAYLTDKHHVTFALGDWLMHSAAENGYWCNDFGWCNSPLAATGHPVEALRSLPAGCSWVQFKDAKHFED